MGDDEPVDLPDDQLVAGALAGDDSSCAALVDRYGGRLYRWLDGRAKRTNVKDRNNAAHDLVQETFVKFFMTLDRFDATQPVSPWLFRIATNVFFDWLRTQRKRQREDPWDPNYPRSELASPRPGPERVLLAIEELTAVKRAWVQLSKRYQEVLRLKLFANATSEEIGEVIGRTSKQVDVIKFRAMRRLERLIDQSRR